MKIDIKELKKAMQDVATSCDDLTIGEAKDKMCQAATDNVIKQLIRIRQQEEDEHAVDGVNQLGNHVMTWLKSIKEQQ